MVAEREAEKNPKEKEKCRRKSSLLRVKSNVGMYGKVGDRRWFGENKMN